MSKVLRYKFDCNGFSAPAYSCSEPHDNSGFYVQATDYDELEAERDALRNQLDLVYKSLDTRDHELEEALQEISSLQQCDCIVRGAE